MKKLSLQKQSAGLKIAITGHTSGIGKGLYNFYIKDHQVMGFSRSNGFDIETKQDKILEKSKNCDIFINNAYSGFAQTDLLFKLWDFWRNKEKLIINVNSMIRDLSFPYIKTPPFSKYKIHKLALYQAVQELQQSPSKCQVSQITLGVVDTSFFILKSALNKDNKLVSEKKMKIKDVVEVVNMIVTCWKKIKIHDIVVGETK